MCGALAIALSLAQPLAAGPVERIGHASPGMAILDIRAEGDCLERTLPGARCLPAAWLFDASGAPIGMHALRWLLGTVGLSGDETLVIYQGGTPGDAAWSVAALAWLAGQNQVAVFDGAGPGANAPGTPRSFSREAVFVARVRLEAMTIDPAAAPDLAAMAEFAREGGMVAFPPAG